MHVSELNRRLFFFGTVVVTVFFIIFLNLFRIHVISGGYWKRVADNQYSKGGEIMGHRGKILSSNGEELVYNIINYSVDIDPVSVKHVDETVNVLSKILEVDSKKLKENIISLQKRGRRYYNVAKEIPYEKKALIEEELAKEPRKMLYSSVYFNKIEKRFAPRESFMSPILGFINGEGKGVFGIESSYDRFLKGESGYEKKYYTTNRDFEIPVEGQNEYISPEDGKNIVLTIDSVMQFVLDDELGKAIKENQSLWAAGIIMNPATGEIMAMSSMPVEDKATLKNKVISNAYEPGSVMKPVVMAMALNENVVRAGEYFNSEGYIKIHDRTIRDHDNSAVGNISLTETIAKSSNVVMAQIGMRFNRDKFHKAFEEFGFGARTEIELPGEIKGILPPVKKWDGVRPATIAFGQGVSVTPLQMTMALAAVVNGGYLMKPVVVKSVENSDGKQFKERKEFEKRKIISTEVSDRVKAMMRETVVNGTGKMAQIEGFDIGGKTGTSQKVINGVYAAGHYTASFVGFFPVEKPEYLCLIIFDDPKGNVYYGGSLAAPVYKKVMQRIIKLKNIMPQNETRETVMLDKYDYGEAGKKQVYTDETVEIPDFEGKDTSYILEYFGSYKGEVTFDGRGVVISQNPKAGTLMSDVKKIHFILGEKKDWKSKNTAQPKKEAVSTTRPIVSTDAAIEER